MKKGPTIEIESLVNAYHAELSRVAFLYLNAPEDVEEAVQNTFIAAHRSYGQFRGDAPLRNWLFGILIRECRNVQRKKFSLKRLAEKLSARTQHSPVPTPEERVAAKDERASILRAVSRLEDGHRAAVILRYYAELPVSEIAETLGIPQGTVHSRLNRARKQLRDLLAEGNEL